jgi:type I restriction enzyme S subunit
MSFRKYAKYKDSGVEWLGPVPEHWNVRRIGAIFRQAYEEGEDDLAILSVSIHDGVSDKELDEKEMDRKITRSDDRSKYKKVQPGDLVYNMMRAWQGAFGSVAVAGMVSPAYVVARPISDFSTPFVEQLLRTPQAIEQMRRYSQGVTDFRLRLYWEEFKAISVVLPPRDEQAMIVDFVDRETAKIDALVGEQRRLIELLKEKRQAVISHAVTKGLNPQAPMKPSGIEWLGDVPEHWTTPPVYLRYEAVLGKMLNESWITGSHPIPYLRNADVQWDYINIDDLPTFDIEPDEYDRFTLRSGDILICEGGAGVGQTAIWHGELDRCAFQKALHRLRPLSSNENPRFFCYCMRFVVDTGIVLAGGTATIPHLTGEKLRGYRFPRPPVDEQVEIIAYLDAETAKLDALTAEAQRAIDLLQERRTALISAAVTGKIDVRGSVESEAA